KAKQVNGMVLGTSNRSEFMTGYFTKFGDGAADIEPIINLYKTHVRKVAKELNVPREIIDRKPTAGLYEGQTDEGEMGITYDNLDKILVGFELHLEHNAISEITNTPEKEIERISEMVERNEHKRYPPKSPQRVVVMGH
ncbi:MAG: NAD(+) synthase, partial [Candidatus Aenigmarchaeota archaeon]|nr:NAD(+) synthase [Candidatus Aenigmarchaeota archaeon]